MLGDPSCNPDEPKRIMQIWFYMLINFSIIDFFLLFFQFIVHHRQFITAEKYYYCWYWLSKLKYTMTLAASISNANLTMLPRWVVIELRVGQPHSRCFQLGMFFKFIPIHTYDIKAWSFTLHLITISRSNK